MDNKYYQSAKYVTLLIATDIVALLFAIIPILGIYISYAMTGIISVGCSIISIYAVYMLCRTWGADFKRAFFFVLFTSLVSILLYLYISQSNPDLELLTLILFAASIVSLIGIYFLMTAFAALCQNMKKQMLADSFLRVRSLFLIAALVGVFISFVFSGRLNLMVELAGYGIRVYLIYLYYRLRKELLEYHVEQDQTPDI